MKDAFSRCHPVVNLAYFVLVLGFAMVLNHPLAQLLSLSCALCLAIQLTGRKAVGFSLKCGLPMLLLAAFVNPAFSHEGVTILLYFPSGNPLTLESLLYGLSAGCLLVTVMTWFLSFNKVLTADKFIYLFGRILPALSLVLSMTLRFIPKFQHQLHQVVEAQRCLGRDVSTGSLWQRTRTAIRILSILITWALENAIETADSMKSRGYGLKGRTAFSIFRFDRRDKTFLVWFGFCGLFLLGGCAAGAFGFRYFPSIRWAPLNGVTLIFYAVYLALCASPVVYNAAEEKKWKALYANM